jgi:hypothetical protein
MVCVARRKQTTVPKASMRSGPRSKVDSCLDDWIYSAAVFFSDALSRSLCLVPLLRPPVHSNDTSAMRSQGRRVVSLCTGSFLATPKAFAGLARLMRQTDDVSSLSLSHGLSARPEWRHPHPHPHIPHPPAVSPTSGPQTLPPPSRWRTMRDCETQKTIWSHWQAFTFARNNA